MKTTQRNDQTRTKRWPSNIRSRDFDDHIILNGDGQKVAELGYTPGGPNAFIAELEKLRKG